MIPPILSAAFNFSAKYHGTENNPVKGVGNFEVTVNKRLNYWEFEEFQTFISVVNDPLYKAFFSTFYFSGARKGELLALTWADAKSSNESIKGHKKMTLKK